MSYTTILLPIIAALCSADTSFLGKHTTWMPANEYQKVFVTDYLSKNAELRRVTSDELASLASPDVTKVNQFLSNNNINTQLIPCAPVLGSKALYMASVLRVAFHWPTAGKEGVIRYGNTWYPSFTLKKGYSIMQPAGGGNPIAILNTKEGDKVYLTMVPGELRDFALLDSITRSTSQQMQDITHRYDGVTMPMVDLTSTQDLSWLYELSKQSSIDGMNYYIQQALQQTNFQMNEQGAAAQSAVLITCATKGVGPVEHTLVFDKPFCLWIQRPGMIVPLFAAYIDPQDWKKPLELGVSSSSKKYTKSSDEDSDSDSDSDLDSNIFNDPDFIAKLRAIANS